MSRATTKILSPLDGGAAGAVSLPVGMMETPVFDAGNSYNFTLQGEFKKTDTPVATTTFPAVSFQLESSVDGNAWAKMTTPAAVALSAEGIGQLSVSNRAARYYKGRAILTGTAATGTIQTFGGTPPGAAVKAIQFTPDGKFCVMTVATAVNVNLYPFAQTTTSLGTVVTGTGSGGSTPAIGALAACLLPLASTGGKYYMGMAGGTTPFGTVLQIAGDGSTITDVPVPAALAGAATGVHFHPTGYFVAYGHASGDGVTIYYFDPVAGKFGALQKIFGTKPNVGTVADIKFSPDGKWLLIVGGTAPFMEVRPVTYDVANQSLVLGEKLPNPTTLPAAAALRCDWHPTGNRFAIIANSTTFKEYPFETKAINPDSPMLSGYTGSIGPVIPNGTIAAAPTNVRYSPDGASIGFTTGTTAFLSIYPLKDMGTAIGTTFTAPTAITSATSYNDVAWHPNMQYVVMGGVGGTAFQQVCPWLFAVQFGACWTGW